MVKARKVKENGKGVLRGEKEKTYWVPSKAGGIGKSHARKDGHGMEKFEKKG